MTGGPARLTVERIFKLGRRPFVLLNGRLDGEAFHVGDRITIGGQVAAVVRAVELHSAPGTTTIAVDAHLARVVTPGVVVYRTV